MKRFIWLIVILSLAPASRGAAMPTPQQAQQRMYQVQTALDGAVQDRDAIGRSRDELADRVADLERQARDAEESLVQTSTQLDQAQTDLAAVDVDLTARQTAIANAARDLAVSLWAERAVEFWDAVEKLNFAAVQLQSASQVRASLSQQISQMQIQRDSTQRAAITLRGQSNQAVADLSSTERALADAQHRVELIQLDLGGAQSEFQSALNAPVYAPIPYYVYTPPAVYRTYYDCEPRGFSPRYYHRGYRRGPDVRHFNRDGAQQERHVRRGDARDRDKRGDAKKPDPPRKKDPQKKPSTAREKNRPSPTKETTPAKKAPAKPASKAARPPMGPVNPAPTPPQKPAGGKRR
ncbi:MAG: hypothetical protein ACREJC_15640 [Tepidisphaeraceae bacterium]